MHGFHAMEHFSQTVEAPRHELVLARLSLFEDDQHTVLAGNKDPRAMSKSTVQIHHQYRFPLHIKLKSVKHLGVGCWATLPQKDAGQANKEFVHTFFEPPQSKRRVLLLPSGQLYPCQSWDKGPAMTQLSGGANLLVRLQDCLKKSNEWML